MIPEDGGDDQEVIANSSTNVKSTAIVKYSAVNSPAPFCELHGDVNLNYPPDNWLRDSDRCRVLRGHPAAYSPRPAFNQLTLASLQMAADFHDCVGVVDVMSNAENIKKLLKMPYSKSQVSMMVHRIGKTLFVDEFDINTYLLRAAKKEWDWLRKFYVEHVLESLELHEKEKSFVRKNRSRDYLQHKSMLSKFLYYSVANRSSEPDEEDVATRSSYTPKPSENKQNHDCKRDDRFSSTSENQEDMFHSFQRNVLWTFDDITMLIGTNLPIFGAGSHPCVSLRLRDITKPINILTGLDYWLDNLMCNVPEVMMCYHLDGIVQKYELIKTEDLPKQENCNFSPKVIKDVAQNVLSFLKSNATKAGHTYWLFKDKNGEVVKLYDLTVLCPEGMDDEERNPVTMHLAMLLYRLARNMKSAKPKKSQLETIALLLQNCLVLLDEKKHPQIVTSSHYLLADIYVPDTVDLSSPTFLTNDSDEEDESEFDDEEVCSEDDTDNDVGEVASSVELKTLCLPGRLESRRGSSNDTSRTSCLLSGTLEERCLAALAHSKEGLYCMEFGTDDQEIDINVDSTSSRNEKINCDQKEEVQAQAKPFNPIPLHYEPLTRSPSSDMRIAPNAPFRNPWKVNYAKLLLRKAALASYILAHSFTANYNAGTALRYTELSFLCYDSFECLTCGDSQTRHCALESHLLSIAGDIHFIFVQQGARASEFHKQYNNFKSIEGLSGPAKKILNRECHYQWAVSYSERIEDNLKISANCYEAALKGAHTEDDKKNLRMRLGNIKNEIGVFYLNHAYSIYNESGELTPEVESLWRTSYECLHSGAQYFEGMDDDINATLLYSNLGRLMRTRAFCYAPDKDGPKEFTAKEGNFYEKAISYYQTSLRILGNSKLHSNVRESVSWELSTTYFTMATLLQDFPPLSTKNQDEIEKEITELMMKALKCIDVDSLGPRQPIYQYRAATIHHRLGTLYHHSYRHSKSDDGRKKQLRTLADISFSKSLTYFQLLEDACEFLRVQLERIGMWEYHAQSLVGNTAKVKSFKKLLELVFETIPILNILIQKTDIVSDSKLTPATIVESTTSTDENAGDNAAARVELLKLLQKRLQFALLNIVKSLSIKSPLKKNSPSSANQLNQSYLQMYKRMYNIALQLPTPSSHDLQVKNLLKAIDEIMVLYRDIP